MAATPVADYALLSDRHSAALVSRTGTVEWLCFPRFDSPSVLGAMLDDNAGHWSLRATAITGTGREYLSRTMVLRTTVTTTTGRVAVTDALAVGSDTDPHTLGKDAPHLLIRQVTGLAGSVDMTVDFAPRPEYGLVAPLISSEPDGVRARGGPARLALSSPIALTIEEGRAFADFTVKAGQEARFGLHWSDLGRDRAAMWSQDELAAQLAETVAAWQRWSNLHQNYAGPYADRVSHSGRVLQALSYQPTGAIVAAATTSLPETVGGERNWDYRYAWIRDAAFSMDALYVAACPDEAIEFFTFMATAAARAADQPLQIMYGVGGERELSERELPHLSGWRDSRPVRIGNGAFDQSQLDVYGELMDTAFRFREQLTEADDELRGFLTGLADTTAKIWRQPDRGIWEIRGTPRHFVHSKVTCWVALDRAVKMAEHLGAPHKAGAWRAERDRIEAEIHRRGWSDEAGAYTQTFDSTELDATALIMPIVGFIPGDDPRMVATIEAVRHNLVDATGLVYRYRTDDGLIGDEGTFLLCTFWLAQALALAGRLREAKEAFDRAAGYANDVGLFAEQVEGSSGQLLGNFPQAFSHIGLINAAWTIAEAERR